MKLIIIRYFLFSILGFETLLLPVLLSHDVYVEIEYYKTILYFVPFLLFGANSGFIYFKYNNNEDYFASLLLIGTIYMSVVSIVGYIFVDNLFFSLCMVVMTLFVIFEQPLKIEKEYFLAMSIKPLISLLLLVSAVLYYYKIIHILTIDNLYYSIVISFIIWILLIYIVIRKRLLREYRISVNNYIKLIKKGFFINLGTLILMVIFFTDRYFTKEYFPEYLLTYSFSFNILQFIVLALTTIAYVNTVDFGENIKNLTVHYIKYKFIYTYKAFLILLVLFSCFVYLLTFIYNYTNLLLITFIMAIFIGNFYALETLGPIAQYKDLQRKITYMLFYMMCLNILFSYLFVYMDIDYLFLLIKTGCFLNLYSIYLVRAVFKAVSDDQK